MAKQKWKEFFSERGLSTPCYCYSGTWKLKLSQCLENLKLSTLKSLMNPRPKIYHLIKSENGTVVCMCYYKTGLCYYKGIIWTLCCEGHVGERKCYEVSLTPSQTNSYLVHSWDDHITRARTLTESKHHSYQCCIVFKLSVGADW